MTKRLFDILLSGVGLIVLAPVLIIVAAVMWLRDGGPIFYISERMKTPETAFRLIKFRTMTVANGQTNQGVTGGDKSQRITRTGAILRKYRIDELPQLVNVLRGDMSLVGPRPPLRQYTQAHRSLYAKVLQDKPGITGLATLYFHRHEERLIAGAKSAAETDAIYQTRCIPRKAELDLIYQRHASVCFDVMILWQTFTRVLRR